MIETQPIEDNFVSAQGDKARSTCLSQSEIREGEGEYKKEYSVVIDVEVTYFH